MQFGAWVGDIDYEVVRLRQRQQAPRSGILLAEPVGRQPQGTGLRDVLSQRLDVLLDDGAVEESFGDIAYRDKLRRVTDASRLRLLRLD